MALTDDQDKPGSSSQVLRRHKGSAISSVKSETDERDDNTVPPRRSLVKRLVGIKGGLQGLFDTRTRRAPYFHSDPRNSEFRYDLLEKDHIRVLRVLAGNKDAELRCELDHMSLRHPQPYTALSYAWGDKYDTVDIELNKSIFNITNSLHGAMRAFREPDRDLLVWADAVCINQKDAEERSKQVQRMHLIYREADLVGIWLGPEADDSVHAMSLIKALTAKTLEQDEVRSIIDSPSWELHFHALVDLFERDYWDRLWVVQEVNNAKRVIVYCGDNRMHWAEFFLVSDTLSQCDDHLLRRFPQATRRGRRTYRDHLLFSGPKSLIPKSQASFTDHMGYFRSRLASDPRDKLYGLLGILPSHIQHHFTPNYESSPTKLYVDIVEYVVQMTDSLDIICEAHSLYQGPNLLKLPSWVPDWSQPKRFYSLGDDTVFWRGSDFCASGSVRSEAKLLGNTRNKLRMTVIYIGSIKATGVALGEILDQHEVLVALIDWWYTFLRFPAKGDKSFCRTITLGQIDYKGWRWVFYHMVGMLAADLVPHLTLHPEFQSNPAIKMNLAEAHELLDRDLSSRVCDQRFFVTDKDDMGLARGKFDLGCVVCIPLGCKTPVILRPDGNDGEYIFHGDAYVDGFMHGEAVELWVKGKMATRMYTLH